MADRIDRGGSEAEPRLMLSADHALDSALPGQPGRDRAHRFEPGDQAQVDLARGQYAGEVVAITSKEQLLEFMRAARERFAGFRESPWVRDMARDRALEVRRMRAEELRSWRSVAARAWELWGGAADEDWSPPSNQLMGIALCERAAALLGEDPKTTPWN